MICNNCEDIGSLEENLEFSAKSPMFFHSLPFEKEKRDVSKHVSELNTNVFVYLLDHSIGVYEVKILDKRSTEVQRITKLQLCEVGWCCQERGGGRKEERGGGRGGGEKRREEESDESYFFFLVTCASIVPPPCLSFPSSAR